MFIPPSVIVAGVTLAARLLRGSDNGSAAPSRPSRRAAAPEFDFYSVGKSALKSFAREHPDLMHYTECAKMLAANGFDELAEQVMTRGRELMAEFNCQRYIVCADFRAA